MQEFGQVLIGWKKKFYRDQRFELCDMQKNKNRWKPFAVATFFKRSGI